jgi:hypothetical protein
MAKQQWPKILSLRARQIVLASALIGSTAFCSLPLPNEMDTGARDDANYLLSRSDLDNGATVVASTVPGVEGALIAEIAARDEHRPKHFVLRASKLLYSATWNGLDYRALHPTPAAMRQALDRIPTGFLVVDLAGGAPAPHERMLLEMLRQYPEDWRVIYSRPTSRCGACPPGRLTIYRRTRDLAGERLRIYMDLRDKLGAILQLGD